MGKIAVLSCHIARIINYVLRIAVIGSLYDVLRYSGRERISVHSICKGFEEIGIISYP